jgi:hypothetical protein
MRGILNGGNCGGNAIHDLATFKEEYDVFIVRW